MLFAQSFKMGIMKISQMIFWKPFEHLDQNQLDLVVGFGVTTDVNERRHGDTTSLLSPRFGKIIRGMDQTLQALHPWTLLQGAEFLAAPRMIFDAFSWVQIFFPQIQLAFVCPFLWDGEEGGGCNLCQLIHVINVLNLSIHETEQCIQNTTCIRLHALPQF